MEGGDAAPVALSPLTRSAAAGEVFDVVGTSPRGESVAVGVLGTDTDTLVAFLSSGCLTCSNFWTAFSQPGLVVPGGARLVVVTKGPGEESESSVARLAPADVPTVMSTEAWHDYGVPVAPYFIYVRSSGEVSGEGAASNWTQVEALITRGLADGFAAGQRARSPRDPDEKRADLEIAAAGITPGHPSLRPTAADTSGAREEKG